MYVEIDFNLIYQVERIAQQAGRSVTEIINEAVAQYLERQPAADDSTPTTPDDPA